jgi:hypothetical protein
MMTQNQTVQAGTRKHQEETAGKKSERKECGKIEEISDSSTTDQH